MLESRYQELLRDIVRALMSAILAKDIVTCKHSLRVSEYALMIGRELKLSREELTRLEVGALLHDIGKIGIPDQILKKPGPLTDDEFKIMKKHSLMSAEIISKIKQLQDVVPIVKHHQERVDGLGYPDGLRGEHIPLLARIAYVADAFDAMTSDRPYRKRLSEKRAFEELERYCGKQFDSVVVKAFMKAREAGISAVSEFFPSEKRKKAVGE